MDVISKNIDTRLLEGS